MVPDGPAPGVGNLRRDDQSPRPILGEASLYNYAGGPPASSQGSYNLVALAPLSFASQGSTDQRGRSLRRHAPTDQTPDVAVLVVPDDHAADIRDLTRSVTRA